MSEFEEQQKIEEAQKDIDARRARDKRKREAKNTENLKYLAHYAERIAESVEAYTYEEDDGFLRSAEILNEVEVGDHLGRDDFYLLLGAVETAQQKIDAVKRGLSKIYNTTGNDWFYGLDRLDYLNPEKKND